MVDILYKIAKSLICPPTLYTIKDVIGIENIPSKKPYVVVANHESYLDPLVIKCIFEKYFGIKIIYLIKKEAYQNTFKKMFFKISGTIPVDRQKGDEKALDEAISRIKSGTIIGIFPEGTRSKDNKIHKGKTGALRIAILAKCPIIAIGIDKSYELWPAHKKLPKIDKKIIIKIGKPIYLDKYFKNKITKKMLRDLTDMVMRKIAQLCDQGYDKS